MKAIVFGEIIWDINGEKRSLGGAPNNFAMHLTALGDSAYLISAVGGDALGRDALSEISSHGVNVEFVSVNGFETGKCNITLNNRGVPSFDVVGNTAYDNVCVDSKTVARLNALNADLFYFGSLIQRGIVSKRSLEKLLCECDFKEIFCDVNIRNGCFDRDSLLFCLKKATYLKLGDEESAVLIDQSLVDGDEKEVMFSLAKSYPQLKLVLLTLGRHGSAVFDVKNDKVFRSGEPEAVKVVSTVGAGDCFGATFISAYMRGNGIPKAICLATQRCNDLISGKLGVV